MEMKNRRLLRKETLKATILKNAEDLFLEKRYGAIGINEIAARSGITKRTLYKYFPSKLALYICMFDEYLKKLSEDMAAAASTDSGSAQLVTTLWDILHEFTRKNEKFMRLFWTLDSDEFAGEIPEELIRRVNEHAGYTFKLAVSANDRARKEGKMIDVDPLLLAHLMSAINKGIFIHVNKERKFNVASLDADDLNDLMRTIMRQGLFKPAAKGRSGKKR